MSTKYAIVSAVAVCSTSAAAGAKVHVTTRPLSVAAAAIGSQKTNQASVVTFVASAIKKRTDARETTLSESSHVQHASKSAERNRGQFPVRTKLNQFN